MEQSRATARVARSALLPNLNADPSFSRQGYSPNKVPTFGNLTVNTFSAPLDLSYEVDLWGRVRRGFESARDEAQASVAALNTVLLTLQADVAENYFTLRALDAEIATVAGNVNLRREQVRLVRFREQNGLGNALEIAQAETELANADAESASLAKHRDELENAIAILVGSNPSGFRLAALTEAGWKVQPPEIPAGLPADLLERRPDVSEAERQLAAANAKIGIAKAAFFPVLTLTGSGGFLSADADTLFNWNSRTWSIGPSLSLPIFAGVGTAPISTARRPLMRNRSRTIVNGCSSPSVKSRAACPASATYRNGPVPRIAPWPIHVGRPSLRTTVTGRAPPAISKSSMRIAKR